MFLPAVNSKLVVSWFNTDCGNTKGLGTAKLKNLYRDVGRTLSCSIKILLWGMAPGWPRGLRYHHYLCSSVAWKKMTLLCQHHAVQWTWPVLHWVASVDTSNDMKKKSEYFEKRWLAFQQAGAICYYPTKGKKNLKNRVERYKLFQN